VAVVIFQAFLAGLSLEMLSSVRAYVGGEGLWSKGQKDAIHFISLYSETGDERFFDSSRRRSPFRSAIVPRDTPWSSGRPIWMRHETASWEGGTILAIFLE
jgi:hypothetical protein